MSTKKIIVIVASSVLLVCVIALCIIVGVNSGNMGLGGIFGLFSNKSVNIDETAKLDLSGVDTVNVDCVSGNINISVGEGSASLKGTVLTASPKDSYLKVTRDGGTLTVKFDADTFLRDFITCDVTLDVSLPNADFSLNVSGASADSRMEGFTHLQNARIDSASGEAHVTGCTGDRLDINLTSGLLDVSGSGFAAVNAGCISGDTIINGITGNVSVTSTSGTVQIANVTGEISVNSTSGDVSVAQEQPALKDIRIGVTSGSVTVTLAPDAAFRLRANSTSGSFNTDFGVTMSGNLSDDPVGANVSGDVNGGGALLDLSTVSGDIRVLKNSR